MIRKRLLRYSVSYVSREKGEKFLDSTFINAAPMIKALFSMIYPHLLPITFLSFGA